MSDISATQASEIYLSLGNENYIGIYFRIRKWNVCELEETVKLATVDKETEELEERDIIEPAETNQTRSGHHVDTGSDHK